MLNRFFCCKTAESSISSYEEAKPVFKNPITLFTYLRGNPAENLEVQEMIRADFTTYGRPRSDLFLTQKEAKKAGKETYPHTTLSLIHITLEKETWEQPSSHINLDDAVIIITKMPSLSEKKEDDSFPFPDDMLDLPSYTIPPSTQKGSVTHVEKSPAPNHHGRSFSEGEISAPSAFRPRATSGVG